MFSCRFGRLVLGVVGLVGERLVGVLQFFYWVFLIGLELGGETVVGFLLFWWGGCLFVFKKL